MANLNEMELQNLRHFIVAHDTIYQISNTYSEQAIHSQIKQTSTKAA